MQVLSPSLCLGIGAGSCRPVEEKGPWFDITAINWGDGLQFELQSSKLDELGLRVAFSRKIQDLNTVQIHPMGQFLYVTEEKHLDQEEHFHFTMLKRPVHFKEALQAIQPAVNAKKAFSWIVGDLSEIELRPLKERGPILGRPFDGGRGLDSDVDWVKCSDFHGSVVASLDSSSYTSIHAHTICSPASGGYGGHLENAVLGKGTYLVLMAAHENIML